MKDLRDLKDLTIHDVQPITLERGVLACFADLALIFSDEPLPPYPETLRPKVLAFRGTGVRARSAKQTTTPVPLNAKTERRRYYTLDSSLVGISLIRF